jgi:hypothetical protein
MDNNQAHPGLVNIRGGGGEADGGFRVTKSAHVGKRGQLNNLMNSAYNSSKKPNQRFRGSNNQANPGEFHLPTSDLGGGRIYEEDIEI